MPKECCILGFVASQHSSGGKYISAIISVPSLRSHISYSAVHHGNHQQVNSGNKLFDGPCGKLESMSSSFSLARLPSRQSCVVGPVCIYTSKSILMMMKSQQRKHMQRYCRIKFSFTAEALVLKGLYIVWWAFLLLLLLLCFG